MAAVTDYVVASAEIRRGKLYLRHRDVFEEQIAQLREGWELEVTVRRLQATRSHAQNSFYWGVVIEQLSERTGFTPDEMHELLKAKFIPKRLAVCDGNGTICDEFVLGGSTRLMDVAAFADYLDAICQWAAETLDLVLDNPRPGLPLDRDRPGHFAPRWYRAQRRRCAD